MTTTTPKTTPEMVEIDIDGRPALQCPTCGEWGRDILVIEPSYETYRYGPGRQDRTLAGREWQDSETIDAVTYHCGACDEQVTLPDTWNLEG
jgi:hypothetical protein